MKKSILNVFYANYLVQAVNFLKITVYRVEKDLSDKTLLVVFVSLDTSKILKVTA